VKSYAAAGQSLLLIPVIRVYSDLARRVGRMQLVGGTYAFFAMNLLLFALAVKANWSVGIAFYLWVGIFNNTVIAQFWSFANDLYTPEQGKRLFAILGIGSSLGAVAGSFVARQLADLGPAGLMLMAAGMLIVVIVLLVWIDRRETPDRSLPGEAAPEEPVLDQPLLSFLLHDRYLMLIALLAFLLNCVNSNGEYILDRTLLETLAKSGVSGEEATRFVGSFKAEYFGWVNLLGVLLQLFAVSRILVRLGVRKALYVMPVVSLLSYSVILVAPLLALIRVGKILENSLDYSVQSTARQALFLVTSRAEKYVGKTAVDTFFVRLGDVASAGAVWLAAHYELPTKAFAAVNLGLILLWFSVLMAIGREHNQRSTFPAVLAVAPEPSQ
jgi:AAA family ATP:ADP antiporter